MENNRIAIVGATGMLGQALMRTAVARECHPVGIARHATDYCIDATDSNALCETLIKIRPSLIINAAAIVNLDRCEKERGTAYLVNAGIVATLTEYCRTNNSKLCHISTDHYFTGDRCKLHDENARVTLLNEYARTKYAGECFARTSVDSLVLRTNVIGFRGWTESPTFIEWVINSLSLKHDMKLFSDFYTSSIDAQSFSTALFDMIERGATGIYNLASREACSKAMFILAIAERLSLSTENCQVDSLRSLNGPTRAESLGLDVTSAEKLLGYNLPSMTEVVNRIATIYGA